MPKQEDQGTENFALSVARTTFKVDAESRTFEALVMPFGQETSDYRRIVFQPGSVSVPEDPTRIKLLSQHQDWELSHLLGHAVSLRVEDAGIYGKFKVAVTPQGDEAMGLLTSGSLDAVSAGVMLPAGAVREVGPDGEDIVLSGGELVETSLVIFPAFEQARISSVTAGKVKNTQPEESNMDKNTPEVVEASVAQAPNYSELMSSMTGALTEGFANVLSAVNEAADAKAAPAPVVTASDVTLRPVYGEGSRHSFVRDAWNVKMGHGQSREESMDRFRHVSAETFAPESQATIPALVPTDNRPDLYLEGDAYSRPLYSAFSKGTLTDATPFRVPSFGSATNLTRDQVEGTNSAEGQITVGETIVNPATIDGLFIITRQLAEGSTPQLDQIAMLEMSKSYEERLEAKLAARLVATTPTVTDPAITGVGNAADRLLIQGLRKQLVDAQFRRGGNAIDRIVANQAAYSSLVSAVDTQERPLLPTSNGVNSFGEANASSPTVVLDGRQVAAGWPLGAFSVMFASRSAWCWTSPVQGFRFEERSGPARIELALFGYHANAFLRPADLIKVTFTRT